MDVTTTHRFVRTDHVDWSIGPDGNITVKDTESGWFFPLNPVATTIWDLVDGTNDVEAIVDAVCDTFEVSRELALQDVSAFLEDARDLDLIT